ncbi:hypothetical protein REPUB_Repub05bG0110400 [Reevesia pubescens]
MKMISSFPQDLITEILSRLGVEDLLRFRCVSKLWCSLIDSHDFIKLHLSHSLKTKTHRSLILQDRHSSYLYSLDLDSLKTSRKLHHPLDQNDEGTTSKILGSCNGLLALSQSDYFEEDLRITLWNPSTRKSQTLPATEISIFSGD